MDEKKMLDRIKKSAANMDIPDSLKPESIEEKIKDVKFKKTKTIIIYRMGGLAAALLLTLIVVWQVNRIGVMERSQLPEADKIAAPKEANSSADVSAGKKESQSEVKDQKDIQGKIAHAGSYGDIYHRLYEEFYTSVELTDERIDMESGVYPEALAGEASEQKAKDVKADSAADSAGGKSDYSMTNIQEQGVDEGDIIKTDGTYIYILDVNGSLRIVRGEQGKMEVIGTVELPKLDETVQEMYLDGDVLNLITSGSSTEVEAADENVYKMNSSQFIKLYTWNIKDRANPKMLGSVTQEGMYRTSRKTGDYIYMFSEYVPIIEEKQETSHYIPKVEGEKMLIDDIFLPGSLNNSSYLVITSVNITEPGKILDKKAIISAAHMFYVSTSSIYICNSNWSNNGNTTQIMKFYYQNGKLQPAGAGEVKGYLNDSLSMNENNEYLRVVTTSWNQNRSVDENNLYVLDSAMNICGRLENLAPGETIRSARFMGDAGYFVTFRQMDPLFSVDLTDPYQPVLLGELKITGFSSYLHFYGENKLLGIGEEVDPDTGENKGLKLSMFDISDPSNVTESDKFVLKGVNYCPGWSDYKAIMIDPAKNIFGFLANETYLVFKYDGENGFVNLFTKNITQENDVNYGADPYEEKQYFGYAYDAKGVYMGDTFYLCDKKYLQSFNMAKEFEEIERLKLAD